MGDAMRKDIAIATVRFNLDLLDDINNRSCFMLLRSVGFLPNLYTLEIFSSSSRKKLEISWLAMLLDSTVSLTSLSLANIELVGSKEEFQWYEKVLQRKCTGSLRKFKTFQVIPFHHLSGWNQSTKTLSVRNSNIEELRIFHGNSTKIGWFSGRLIQSVFTLTKLKVLALNGWQLKKDKLFAITGALEADYPLQYLNLSFNNLGDRGGVLVINSLLNNTHLFELYLANNELGHRSAEATAKLMRCNSALQCLSLSCNNNMGEKGCVEIGASLSVNINSKAISQKLWLRRFKYMRHCKFVILQRNTPRTISKIRQ